MKYEKCERCGANAIHLALHNALTFYGDCDDNNGDLSQYDGEEQYTDVCIGAHICFSCCHLVDVFIEHPRDKIIQELEETKGKLMSLKNDQWIVRMCRGDNPLVSPLIPHQISNGVNSYGLGGHGIDIRVADEFEIFTNVGGAKVVDPKNFDPELLFRFQGAICTIPPNSFALARSIEYFRMPLHVVGILLGKSTYARCGIVTNFTPLEAGWEGHITIEISNTTPLPALIYANEGIAQCLFFESEPAGVGYGDREGGGKYQGQMGITKARV